MMKLVDVLALVLATACIGVPFGSAHAEGGIEVGVLNCSVVHGSRVNLLIRSTADVHCVYAKGGQTEEYVGETGIALGIDLSFKTDEKMAFTVFAASEDISPGARALGGRYVGGELSAATGLGLGAKALVGGGAKNIGLQPIALALAVLAGSAHAESSLQSTTTVYRQKAEQFARERLSDARNFLVGPARPAATSPAHLDCGALYAQRVALTRNRLDYRTNFWDDPRNRAAVFIASAWSGAFYYLPYSALAAYSSAITGPQTQAELDALRAASARQRCFERQYKGDGGIKI